MPQMFFPQSEQSVQQKTANVRFRQVNLMTPIQRDIMFSIVVDEKQQPEYCNLKFGDRAPIDANAEAKYKGMCDAVFCHKEAEQNAPSAGCMRYFFIVPPQEQWRYNNELTPYSPQKNYRLIMHKDDYERNLAIAPETAYLLPSNVEWKTEPTPDDGSAPREYCEICDTSKINEYFLNKRTYITLRPIIFQKDESGVLKRLFQPIPRTRVYERDPDDHYAGRDVFFVLSQESRFEERQLDSLFVKIEQTYITLPGPVEFQPLYKNAYGNEDPVIPGSGGSVWQRNTMANIIPPMPIEAHYELDEEGNPTKRREFIYEWQDFGSGTGDIPAVKKFCIVNPYRTAGRYPTLSDSHTDGSQCCNVPDEFVICRKTGNITVMKALYHPNNTDEDIQRTIDELKTQLTIEMEMQMADWEDGTYKWAIESTQWDVDTKNYDGWRHEVEVSVKFTCVQYSMESLESWERGRSGKRVRTKSVLVSKDEEEPDSPYENLAGITRTRASGCATRVTFHEYDDGRNAEQGVTDVFEGQKVNNQATTDTLSQAWHDAQDVYLSEATDEQKVYVLDEEENPTDELDNRATLMNLVRDKLLEFDAFHDAMIERWRQQNDPSGISFADTKHEHSSLIEEDKARCSCRTTCSLTRWITNSAFGYTTNKELGVKNYRYEITSFKEVIEALFGITITDEPVDIPQTSTNPLARRARYVSWKSTGNAQWVSAANLDAFTVERVTLPWQAKNMNGDCSCLYSVSGTTYQDKVLKVLRYTTTSNENLPDLLSRMSVTDSTGFWESLTDGNGVVYAVVPRPWIAIDILCGGIIPCFTDVEVTYYPNSQKEAAEASCVSSIPVWTGKETSVYMSHPSFGHFSFKGLVPREREFEFPCGDTYYLGKTPGVQDGNNAGWGSGYTSSSMSHSESGYLVTKRTVHYPTAHLIEKPI